MDDPDILTALAAAISKADEAHDINGSREPFLRVIFKFLKPNAKAAIGLWLIDTEGAKETYEATLWQVVHSNLAGPGANAVSQRVPIEKSIWRQDFDYADQHAIHTAFPITIEHGGIWRYLPKKQVWSNELNRSHELLLPLRAKRDEKYTNIGLLHVVAPELDLPRVMESHWLQLRATMATIAALIVSGRHQRLLYAITQFQEALPHAKTPDDLAHALSKVLHSSCSALSCAVYQPLGNEKLIRIADEASPNWGSPVEIVRGTFTFEVFERALLGSDNVLHLMNLDIQGLPGTSFAHSPNTGNDLPKGAKPKETSWLSYAIQSPAGGQGDRGRGVPILFIRLLTAPHLEFLGGTFSTTAREALEKLGIHVSELFSTLFYKEAVKRISQTAPERRLKVREPVAQPGVRTLERKYGRHMKEILPCIKEVYVAERHNADSDFTFRDLDAQVVDRLTPPFQQAARASRGQEKLLSFWQEQDKAGVDVTLYSPGENDYGVRCVLAGPALALYEWRVLEHIVAELRFAEFEALDVAEKVKEIAEIRHALRAGLNGVFGHLHVVKQQYNLSHKMYLEGRAQAATHLFLETAKVHKSLDWALHASEQVRDLFENIAILIATMSPTSLHKTNVDLTRVLRNSKVSFAADLERRHLEWVDKSRTDVSAVCDPRLIEMAIYNLIDNAVKYSFANNKVVIEAVALKTEVAITVTNTGPWIEPSKQKEIFQQFKRVAFRGIQPMPGTGLGLPVSEKIALIHGGQISVDSRRFAYDEVVRGVTTFRLSLPKGAI